MKYFATIGIRLSAVKRAENQQARDLRLFALLLKATIHHPTAECAHIDNEAF